MNAGAAQAGSAGAPPAVIAMLLAAFFGGTAPACCLVRPPHARELVVLRQRRTPEQAFLGFQTAMRADLPDEEYRCFSAGFRRANNLSLHSYVEGRRILLEENPWFVLFAKAKVVESEGLDERHHRLVVSVPTKRLVVELIREDYWEMWAGEELLADGLYDFDRAVEQTDPAGLRAEVLLEPGEASGVDLGRVTELRIGQEWKIDQLYEAPSE